MEQNEQLDALYTRKVKCNVCTSDIEVTEIKTGKTKLKKMDADMCPHYDGPNPVFYDVWVCPNCGYAALAKDFDKISHKNIDVVRDKVSSKWNERDISGPRDTNRALRCYKLALVVAAEISAPSSKIANICLRIAWMHRFLKNTNQEKEFLKYASNYYEKAYLEETFPFDKLDEPNYLYLMGEINRQLGENDKAEKYFSKVISMPAEMKKPSLNEKVRIQRELMRKES